MSKTVLITGTSSGIGKGTAKYFQEKGWNVVATMRTPEKEEELTQLENVLVIQLDVTDLESVDRAVKAGIEKFGSIDVLVNNAGYGAFGPLEAFSWEAIMRQINTNLIGIINTTRAVLPHFRANKEGVIINVSSVGGKVTFPLNSLYHATKFAVEGLTEGLVFELQDLGIKAKIIEPGGVATDFLGRSFDFNNDETLTEYQPMMQKILGAFENMEDSRDKMATPKDAGAVIYEAATDGKDQIRYLVGDDASMYLSAKFDHSDEEYITNTRKMYGI